VAVKDKNHYIYIVVNFSCFLFSDRLLGRHGRIFNAWTRKRTYFLLTQADHFLRRAKSRQSQKIGHDLYSSDTRYSLLLKIQTPKIHKAAAHNGQIFVFWSSGYDPNRAFSNIFQFSTYQTFSRDVYINRYWPHRIFMPFRNNRGLSPFDARMMVDCLSGYFCPKPRICCAQHIRGDGQK